MARKNHRKRLQKPTRKSSKRTDPDVYGMSPVGAALRNAGNAISKFTSVLRDSVREGEARVTTGTMTNDEFQALCGTLGVSQYDPNQDSNYAQARIAEQLYERRVREFQDRILNGDPNAPEPQGVMYANGRPDRNDDIIPATAQVSMRFRVVDPSVSNQSRSIASLAIRNSDDADFERIGMVSSISGSAITSDTSGSSSPPTTSSSSGGGSSSSGRHFPSFEQLTQDIQIVPNPADRNAFVARTREQLTPRQRQELIEALMLVQQGVNTGEISISDVPSEIRDSLTGLQSHRERLLGNACQDFSITMDEMMAYSIPEQDEFIRLSHEFRRNRGASGRRPRSLPPTRRNQTVEVESVTHTRRFRASE